MTAKASHVEAVLSAPLDASDAASAIEEEGDVIAGAGRKIMWADSGPGVKTTLSVVFLHGFSACRRECDPLPKILGEALGANVYMVH